MRERTPLYLVRRRGEYDKGQISCTSCMHHGYRHADDDDVPDIALPAYGSPNAVFGVSSFARLEVFAAFGKDDACASEERYVSEVEEGKCSNASSGTRPCRAYVHPDHNCQHRKTTIASGLLKKRSSNLQVDRFEVG